MKNYYTVTPWVSWRNYRTASEADFRSLISNEKTHEYFLLEGKSAEIWQALTSDVGCLPSLEADDVNEFILSLQMAGLIHFSEETIDHTITKTPPQEPESVSDALGKH